MNERHVVTVGVELRVTTGQLDEDLPALVVIRESLASMVDDLVMDAPGSKEVSLFWGVDHAGTIERYELEEEP